MNHKIIAKMSFTPVEMGLIAVLRRTAEFASEDSAAYFAENPMKARRRLLTAAISPACLLQIYKESTQVEERGGMRDPLTAISVVLNGSLNGTFNPREDYLVPLFDHAGLMLARIQTEGARLTAFQILLQTAVYAMKVVPGLRFEFEELGFLNVVDDVYNIRFPLTTQQRQKMKKMMPLWFKFLAEVHQRTQDNEYTTAFLQCLIWDQGPLKYAIIDRFDPSFETDALSQEDLLNLLRVFARGPLSPDVRNDLTVALQKKIDGLRPSTSVDNQALQTTLEEIFKEIR